MDGIMIDLPVGSKFHFGNKLVEVVESENECSKCAFHKRIFSSRDYDEYFPCCYAMNCSSVERKDKKDVYFKEVEE